MTRIYSRGTPLERAFRHVIISNGCWDWNGALSAGYANLNLGKGRYKLVHILFYEHFVGEVPDGHELDHLCHQAECVNPWHQEPVPHRENFLRGNAIGALLHRTGVCKRGHSLADAYRDKRGRVRNCKVCRNEQRRVALRLVEEAL
ncbi:MAG: HNH endonuclease [Dehalococcoidia bacterium]|nr:HNH endonuclease [Dehalococcoidia bacterium]